MKITVDIDDKEIQKVIKKEVIEAIEGRVYNNFQGDAMSRYWKVIDKEIEAYLSSEEFLTLIRATIAGTRDEVVQALKDRILDNA